MASRCATCATPQVKGQIGREHQYWQGRRPALFAAETITTPETANALLPNLRRHRKAHEIHRELARTPNATALAAQREKRSVLRVVPRCPWRPFTWSRRTPLQVGPDGRVPIGHERLRVGVSAGTRVLHCLQPNGTISILAHQPKTGEWPVLLSQIRAQRICPPLLIRFGPPLKSSRLNSHKRIPRKKLA